MRTLFESIISRDKTYTELERTTIKTDLFHARPKWMALVDKYKEQFKEEVVKGVGEWMKEHPTKRNVSAGSDFTVGVSLFEESPLFDELYREMSNIGLIYSEFVNPKVYYGRRSEVELGEPYYTLRYDVSAPTYKQFKEDNYKVVEKVTKDVSPIFTPSRYGNGYNNLPADDMTILRQKMYDCVKGFEVVVYKVEYKYESDHTPLLPNYHIVVTALFDRKKMKDLLTELRADKRLQHFADVMDEVGKGIADYYASKGPGDYVGD